MMFKAIEKPRVAVIGVTLELYRRKFPGYITRLQAQLERFTAQIRPLAQVTGLELCWTTARIKAVVAQAEKADADAILLVPLSYTCSGTVVPPLMKTKLPLIIWNTQEAATITAKYNFDDLLMNHVTQGTQDITSVLLRRGRPFGMESGHYRDKTALLKLAEWLDAARACRHAQRLRVGILGKPFKGMDDFHYDPARMADWGATTVKLSLKELLSHKKAVKEKDIEAVMAADRKTYTIAPDVTPAIHRLSIRLELALRRMLTEARLDAFTMNFLDLIKTPEIGTLPFTGINKLIGEGMGYAGEGDILRAAQMAALRSLAGAANFTEIYTIDYQRNRLMMTHMQECNPALARCDRRIKLVKKEFWAPGIQPYAGMWFTLEPGPVTLTALTVGPDNRFHYITRETKIENMAPLRYFDIPHWIVRLDEPAGDFLTRYSMAGGPHHLIALPGRQSSRLQKLARLQNLPIIDISPGAGHFF